MSLPRGERGLDREKQNHDAVLPVLLSTGHSQPSRGGSEEGHVANRPREDRRAVLPVGMEGGQGAAGLEVPTHRALARAEPVIKRQLCQRLSTQAAESSRLMDRGPCNTPPSVPSPGD